MIEKFSRKQKQILRFVVDDEHQYIICDGAVRAGKTLVMSLSFVIWAMENFKGCNFGICAKTVSNAERNILMPLLNSELLQYSMKYHRADRMLAVSMGGKTNRFYLFGGKDESSYQLIQGITLAGVLLDEITLMPRNFVEQAMARTLTYANRKIWFNCNPEGSSHWFNQEWIIPADEGKRPDVRHLHFLMSDNPILGEQEIRNAESMFSGVFYSRYILGLWVAAEGIIYDSFDPNIHVLDEEPETEGDWYVSSDFGIQNANVFLLWRSIKGTEKVLCVDEWYYSGRDERKQKSVAELVDGLEQMLGDRYPRRVIIDPSASALKVELRRRGFKVQDADNSVLDGISDVSTMLSKNRLFFMWRCRHTIEEFGQYAWDTKAADKGVDAPIKMFDHCMDAMRYFVRTRKLVKRGLKPVETSGFLF